MPYTNPLRHRLRQRRLRGRAGPRAGAGGLGGLRGAPRARRAGAGATAASASATTSRSPPARRASAREITVRRRAASTWSSARSSAGQGHETSFAQLIAEWLGVEPDQVRLITGDTDRVAGRRRLALRPLDAPGRRGDGEGGGPDRGEGRPHRRVAARVRGRRPRVRASGGSACSGTDRAIGLFEVAAAARAARRAGGPARAARRRERRDGEHAVLPVRLRGVRGGGGSGDRRGGGRPLHVGGRRGPRHQPADRGRPDPRRHRPGRGPGAVGALPLRRGERPAPVRDLHGVRDAARRSAALVHHRDQRGAVDLEPARPAGRRRGRHDPGARGRR